jgi:hypothetical protein
MDEQIIARAAPEGRAAPAPRREAAGMRGGIAFALSAASVLALSFGIAWPLWLAATESRALFNALFAAAVLATAAFLVASRATRPRDGKRRARREARG